MQCGLSSKVGLGLYYGWYRYRQFIRVRRKQGYESTHIYQPQLSHIADDPHIHHSTELECTSGQSHLVILPSLAATIPSMPAKAPMDRITFVGQSRARCQSAVRVDNLSLTITQLRTRGSDRWLYDDFGNEREPTGWQMSRQLVVGIYIHIYASSYKPEGT